MQSSALEEARHKLQMKYKKEAEEAAEKKKQVSNSLYQKVFLHLDSILLVLIK
jgi:transposase